MQQNRIHSNDSTTEAQSHSEFVNTTRELVIQHSRELQPGEIQDCIDRGKTKQLLQKVWEFAGCYRLWPERLLARSDITNDLRDSLRQRYHDKNGLKGTVPLEHLAKSIGISLPDPPPQGWLISSAIISAEHSQLSEALGKYFANECLPNWPELTSTVAGALNIDLPVVDPIAQSTAFYHELSFDQDRDIFAEAAQAYAIQHTIYTNQIRALI